MATDQDAVPQGGSRSAGSHESDWGTLGKPTTAAGWACAKAWGHGPYSAEDIEPGQYDESRHNPKDMAPPWEESWWAWRAGRGNPQIDYQRKRPPPLEWGDRDEPRGPGAGRK